MNYILIGDYGSQIWFYILLLLHNVNFPVKCEPWLVHLCVSVDVCVHAWLWTNEQIWKCVCFPPWRTLCRDNMFIWISCGYACPVLHPPFAPLHAACLVICLLYVQCAHCLCFLDTVCSLSLACHHLAFPISPHFILFVSGPGCWSGSDMVSERGCCEGRVMSGMWGGAGEGANVSQPLRWAEKAWHRCAQFCIFRLCLGILIVTFFNVTLSLHWFTNWESHFSETQEQKFFCKF